jgi:hypothetical protein
VAVQAHLRVKFEVDLAEVTDAAGLRTWIPHQLRFTGSRPLHFLEACDIAMAVAHELECRRAAAVNDPARALILPAGTHRGQ